ncbi:MAG: proteasome assembly chaperone family protein [Nanoarchaeota archaeon]|nr:proteasome assembly chaperone family protein [Nanoarchaeota archaeon]
MELILTKKPKGVTIIEGFPGFGLVGTIATEYLVNHLKCELIGRYWFEELPATTAIHNGLLVQPIGIYYNKKYHLVIIHSIAAAQGVEWKAAKIVLKVASLLNAKEIVSLEGVGTNQATDNSKVYYYSNNAKKKTILSKYDLQEMKEGIIMGITSALMVMCKKTLTCFFAETHTKLPDSGAAAKIIEFLDKYLGLDVDTKPLLEKAQDFEDKLKGLLQKGAMAQKEKQEKALSYVG